MSNDQIVSLPADVLSGSQKFDVANLLATATRFSLGSSVAGNQLERDLDVRFSGLQTIGFADAVAWLNQAGAKLTPLDDQVAALQTNNDAEPLHQALQASNNAQQLQLLAINDASKLIEMENRGEASLTPCPLTMQAQSCLLLRLGYNTENDYAYYAASLPGNSRRPIKITWPSIITAGVSAAVAILPAPKPIDMDAVQEALHILGQSALTFSQAHAALCEHLGVPALALPAATQQAV